MNFSQVFFSGIAGTGMSAVAQYLAFRGGKVSGSDRSFDKGEETGKRDYFLGMGIRLFPQDGSGLDGASCLAVSTAIETQSPEIRKARELGIPVMHRADILAALAGQSKTLAVSGTSGKSTVTGMAYHVLEAGGLNPSLITGANLVSLQREGLLGNAKAGTGEWLVIEADESDGTLVKYHPEISLILNVEKDHKEVEELLPLFHRFRDQTARRVILNGADSHCREMRRDEDAFFYPDSVSDGRVEDLILSDWETRFTVAGTAFQLNVPGRHNLANAMAAIAAGRELGISLADCARGLAAYQGVERRHVKIGEARGVTIVDDFAHNPAKVKACLETVKFSPDGSPRRILAVFHPHGFAPMKLIGHELVAAILEVLGPDDRIYMPEIYYAGGTADKSISSRDLIDEINSVKSIGYFCVDKEAVLAALAAEARPEDWIVTMGARDPSLDRFAHKILDVLSA